MDKGQTGSPLVEEYSCYGGGGNSNNFTKVDEKSS